MEKAKMGALEFAPRLMNARGGGKGGEGMVWTLHATRACGGGAGGRRGDRVGSTSD